MGGLKSAILLNVADSLTAGAPHSFRPEVAEPLKVFWRRASCEEASR